MSAVGALHDIAVVGAGPVGALTALQLARAGHKVLLLDAAAEPREALPQGDYDLRVIAMAPGSQAQLAQVGAWPEALLSRVQPYTGMQVWDGSGPGKIAFSAAELGLPALGHIVEVPALQWALDQAIAVSGIQREQGAEYARHELTADGVELHCRDGRSFAARLLIGADGRDSKVRKRAGIAVERRDYGQQGVVAVIRPEQPHEGVARQVFTDIGPLGLLPLANGQISIVWSVPDEQVAGLLDDDPALFCRKLARETGQSGFELISRRVGFPLILQHAASYSSDVVALVGDAAHAVHPLAGLGMNLGIEDAAALAQQLQGCRSPAAMEHALTLYARARRPAVLPAIAMMDGLNVLFGSHAGEVVRLRDFGLNLVDGQARVKQAFMRYALGSDVSANDSRGSMPV